MKNTIPLRERKLAQRKLAIAESVMKRIKQYHIEEISVKEVCEELQISEGNFFNYFPKKGDILNFIISLWSLDVGYQAGRVDKGKPLEAIETVFSYTVEKFMDIAPVIYEIICYIAKQREMVEVKDLNRAEKMIAFPDQKGIEDHKAIPLVEIMRPYIVKAVERGDLPEETEVELTLLILRSIFFGTPLALTQAHVNKLGPIYKTRLKMLWIALREGNNGK